MAPTLYRSRGAIPDLWDCEDARVLEQVLWPARVPQASCRIGHRLLVAANFSKMPDALGLTDLTFGEEITMMTKEQAKDVVEAELRSLNLSKPMMTEEMTSFCQGMYRRLQFKSPNERLADIRRWADDWQAATFRNT